MLDHLALGVVERAGADLRRSDLGSVLGPGLHGGFRRGSKCRPRRGLGRDVLAVGLGLHQSFELDLGLGFCLGVHDRRRDIGLEPGLGGLFLIGSSDFVEVTLIGIH